MRTPGQRYWVGVSAVALGALSVVVLNCLLHSGRRPWTSAGANMLLVQGVLTAAAPLVAVPLFPFRRTRRAGVAIVLASLLLFLAAALSFVVWASMPAYLSANVINSSSQRIAEVIFIVQNNTFRLNGLAPSEHRVFRFSVGAEEASMAVRARTVTGEEASAECATYINWALSRADYDVEISAPTGSLKLRCIERDHELKF